MEIGHGRTATALLVLLLTCVWVKVSVAGADVAGAAGNYACDEEGAAHKYGFCDAGKSIEERAADLVGRLQLHEKVLQLVNDAKGVPRLGIPDYQWWSESLHGISKWGYGIHFGGSLRYATSFPQVILSAASFNASLWHLIGQTIGTEARAIFNERHASGLTFWSPNINIFRDPRWGRGQETPGEDPLLTSSYSVAYVRGVQGETLAESLSHAPFPGELRASACCKHFTAYDLENWEGNSRFSFDALVTKQDLLDTYQPPFKSCVEQGRSSGIMCSYNSVNGIPACADYDLLTKTARKEWGFQGYITSDCDAVSIIYTPHNYTHTPEEAVADVLKAGMDVNCGDYLKKHTIPAIEKGILKESDVDRALRSLYAVRMRLGLFDRSASERLYGGLGYKDVCSDKHREIALDAARQGIVLLKNDVQRLPLSTANINSLAVIGPNANNATTQLANYYGIPCINITIFEGLQKYVQNIEHAEGCHNVACESDSKISEAIEVAKNADAVVLVVGLDQDQETEELDRVKLTLPGQQQKLVQQVSEAARKPIIMVILSGGPLDVSFAVEDNNVGSIVWAGYPGQAGGKAVAEVIFGDHNPGGRLPVTWYPQEFTRIPMTDMHMRPNSKTGYPGRTYRFYNGPKVFEFGHGLSYSRYSYKFSPKFVSKTALALTTAATKKSNEQWVNVQQLQCKALEFKCEIEVKNEGKMDGSHTVLLYTMSPATHEGAPIKQLIGFSKHRINAGGTTNVVFVVKPCQHLSTVLENGDRVLALGSHILLAGDAQVSVSIV